MRHSYLYSDSRVTTNYNRDDEWTRHTTRQLEVARVRLNSSDGVAQLHGRAISLQRDAIREDRVRDQFARQQQADFNRRTRDIIVANQRREAIQAQREAVFRQRTMQEMARMRNQVVAATMAANQRRRY